MRSVCILQYNYLVGSFNLHFTTLKKDKSSEVKKNRLIYTFHFNKTYNEVFTILKFQTFQTLHLIRVVLHSAHFDKKNIHRTVLCVELGHYSLNCKAWNGNMHQSTYLTCFWNYWELHRCFTMWIENKMSHNWIIDFSRKKMYILC